MQFFPRLFLVRRNTIPSEMPQNAVAAITEIAEQIVVLHKFRTGQISLQECFSGIRRQELPLFFFQCLIQVFRFLIGQRGKSSIQAVNIAEIFLPSGEQNPLNIRDPFAVLIRLSAGADSPQAVVIVLRQGFDLCADSGIQIFFPSRHRKGVQQGWIGRFGYISRCFLLQHPCKIRKPLDIGIHLVPVNAGKIGIQSLLFCGLPRAAMSLS